MTSQPPDARPGPSLSPPQPLARPSPGSSSNRGRPASVNLSYSTLNLTGFALVLRDPSPSPVATDSLTRVEVQSLRIQDLWPHRRLRGGKSLYKQEKGHILISAALPGLLVPWQPWTPAHLEPRQARGLVSPPALGRAQAARPLKPRASSCEALPRPAGPGRARPPLPLACHRSRPHALALPRFYTFLLQSDFYEVFLNEQSSAASFS